MIVLGIDGATPTIVFNWVNQGILPNLQRILKESSYGILWSISTSSASAWTAHLTGVPPERNGINSFLKNDRFIRTWDIKTKTYPELLCEKGYKVYLVNMPLTWPPLELKGGGCIAGEITPVERKDYTYPDTLLDEIDEYEIGVRYEDRRYSLVDDKLNITFKQLKNDVMNVEKKRLRASLELMKTKKWDLFFVLVQGTDTLQHYFWHEIDTMEATNTTIFELYLLLDKYIGIYLKEFPEEEIVILSDHGFQRDYFLGTRFKSGLIMQRFKTLLGGILPDYAKQNRIYGVLFDLFTRSFGFLGKRTINVNNIVNNSEKIVHTGNHDRKGIWLVKGKRVKKNYKIDLSYLDITTVIMYMMGVSIPKDYSQRKTIGKIFTEKFTPKFDDINIDIERKPLESEDELKIKEKLADLGYIDMVERKKYFHGKD